MTLDKWRTGQTLKREKLVTRPSLVLSVLVSDIDSVSGGTLLQNVQCVCIQTHKVATACVSE